MLFSLPHLNGWDVAAVLAWGAFIQEKRHSGDKMQILESADNFVFRLRKLHEKDYKVSKRTSDIKCKRFSVFSTKCNG
jgi:hypothetical protein